LSRIKVLHVIARLNIGGSALHAILVTRDLDPQRFQTTLVTGIEETYEGGMREWAATQGVNPLIIPELGREINLIADVKVLFKLYRLFCRERPDIVHTHTAKAGFVGRLAARLAGVPIVVHTFHGHIFHSYFGPLKTRLFIWIERILAYLTDRIITVSQLQRQEIIDFGVASLEKIAIIPYGFDLQPFLVCDDLRGQLRTELALTEDVKLVGILARLTAIKNHQLFLKAAALINQCYDKVCFIIIGDGELRTELEQQVTNLGLTQVVRFLGWRQDLPVIYADLDLVVLTSRNEGAPTTLIEAQAAACPVVATAVGGVPDIVVDGQSGYLVPPDDAEALAGAALKALLEGNAREMGQAGRRAVREKFAVERLVHDIESLYRELIDIVFKKKILS
jgi:glycosyltransferase involved in cell wall biosynthesis